MTGPLTQLLVPEGHLADSLLDLGEDSRPRVWWAPPSLSTTGLEAVDLCESAGLVLDDWQAWALDVILAEAEDGDWAAFETAVLVARQNGKGGIIEAIELCALFLLGEKLILHSAHEFKTSKEAYLRIRSLIENAPHLHKLVKQFRQSNEDTSVELLNGARLRFMARSRSSGKGFSAQRLIIDEAQILSTAAMAALMPTLAAQTNPQINYFGTVPRPEDDSEHWTSLRDRGRSGQDMFLAWIEWSAGESMEDVDLDDEELWRRANPARRVSIAFMRKERASLTDEDFARERLSIWGASGSQTVVDLNRWGKLADEDPPKATHVGLALDVTPDRAYASVSFAGRRPDGRRHVEVIENRQGTGWCVDVIVTLVEDKRRAKLPCPVVVDASGPAGSLIGDLKAAGVDVIVASARDMANACGDFYDSVVAEPPMLTHFDQPTLNVALAAARWRPLGDARAWHRKDSTDISPLVSCSLALLALAESERGSKKKRTGKVW